MKKTVLVALAFLSSSVVFAGSPKIQPLHVKPGLWQITLDTKVKGGIPPEMEARLNALPPAQRAKLETMMKSRFGGAPMKKTFKSCLTAKDLNNAKPWGNECKWKVLKSTGTDMVAKGTSCALGAEQGLESQVTIKIHVIDSKHVKSSIKGSATGGGQTYTVNGTRVAKWVGATCPK